MKKLILFLLLIPALVSAQSIVYYPKRVNSWDTKTLRDVGFLVVTPANFHPAIKYKLEIAIHGVGEWSNGTLDNLKNLALGFDNNGDGIREGAAFITTDKYKAVNQYDIILIVPTYETETFFEPAKINYLYDWAQSQYSLYPKMLLTGFSYGGGAVFKYITSSTANANRVAYAVPVAAVSRTVDAKIPGAVGLPVHAFSNDKDDRVASSNTINQVNAINATASLKALYTLFRKDGHGGNIEAWSLTPPKAPNGQGFTDAAENIYQVFSDIISTGKPRQMRSGAVQPLPVPEPDPDPVPVPIPTTLTAEFNLTSGQVINTPTFEMDASPSTGVKSGWDGYSWDVKVVEKGSYATRPEGGAYGGPKKKLINLVDGKYSITLTVRDGAGKTASKTAAITVALQVSKLPVAFDSETDLIYYSDGTSEKGVAVFSAGKWVVKNAAGQIIDL